MSSQDFVFTLLLLLMLLFRNVYCKTVWLENVGCDTYIDYIETDPVYSRYLPYVVTLHRCKGAVGLHKPSVKKCVPKNVSDVEIVTQNLETFRYETIKVVNHTSCMGRCTYNASLCTKYQWWNEKVCRCECKYDREPRKDACCSPKIWSNTYCNCLCPLSISRECPKRKVWSDENCGCVCREKQFHKCAAYNLTLDLNSCRCINYVSFEQARPCVGHGLKLSFDIVVLVCVAEALLIAFGYAVYYIICHKAQDTSHEVSRLLGLGKNEKLDCEDIELHQDVHPSTS